MADRFKFAEVRQEVIEMLKKDLLGPSSENEILNQNPRFEYIVGMLAPQTSENDSNEQEVDGDASFEGDADYTAGHGRPLIAIYRRLVLSFYFICCSFLWVKTELPKASYI